VSRQATAVILYPALQRMRSPPVAKNRLDQQAAGLIAE
jgi:hypothetical protein